jgi:hypothetical protein
MSARVQAFDDRLNPILVKEVRQALRGRYFRALFWLTLGVATLVGLSVTAQFGVRNLSESAGQAFFMVMFACLTAAVQGFTPFSAFLSTSAEWDENTHDLLVLSNLRPRQIVYGKLLSALVQALLYYSTFGPFLVFAFLLNGVDLRVIAVTLAGSMAVCTCLTLLGVATASLSPAKAPRILLMALFGVALMIAWGMSLSFAGVLMESPQILREPMALTFVAGFVCTALFAGAFFAALAVARLSHDEENRSSGMRVLSAALVFAAAAWGAWLNGRFGEHEPIWALQLGVMAPLALMWLFFLTEPENLGRHVEQHVSRRPLLAWLTLPFLPGGGRGALLMAVHMLAALAGAALALWLDPPSEIESLRTLMVIVAFYAYAWVYLAAPAAIASWFVTSTRGRIVARMAILTLAPLVLLGPPLVGLLFGIPSWIDFLHPFNPVWAAVHIVERDMDPVVALTLLWLAFGVALLVNVPRITRGVVEVLAASRRRRERRAAPVQPS